MIHLLKLRCYEVFFKLKSRLRFVCCFLFSFHRIECIVYIYLRPIEWSVWINSICHGEEITRQENNHQIANANDLNLHHFKSEKAKWKRKRTKKSKKKHKQRKINGQNCYSLNVFVFFFSAISFDSITFRQRVKV